MIVDFMTFDYVLTLLQNWFWTIWFNECSFIFHGNVTLMFYTTWSTHSDPCPTVRLHQYDGRFVHWSLWELVFMSSHLFSWRLLRWSLQNVDIHLALMMMVLIDLIYNRISDANEVLISIWRMHVALIWFTFCQTISSLFELFLLLEYLTISL